MSRKDRLHELLTNPHIWQTGQNAVHRAVLPSGFAALDEHLGGGWPLGVLTEILIDEQGIGELRLLMPALVALGHPDSLPDSVRSMLGTRRQICWLMPPYIPYAPGLVQQQLDLSRILIVNAERQTDALWAMEQALRSRACVAVLGWFANVNQHALRRLQLAAEEGCCWAIIFRHSRFSQQAPAAPLRIQLIAHTGSLQGVREASATQLELTILRNRYGPEGSLSLTC